MSSFEELPQSQDKKPLSSYICHDPKSLGSSRNKVEKDKNGSSSSQFKRVALSSERSNSKSLVSADSRTFAGPLMDEVAIKAVIAILSGYVGRYVKDEHFRGTIREKCNSVLERRIKDSSDDEFFVNMELGMEKVDRLVEDQGTKKHAKNLRNSIEILTIVASLNSKTSKDASTWGVSYSNLSACAELYLAIAYKLQKNERVSSKHLLQVFGDSPCLARTYLLPDLWEHFFLPHLLHLKIWYNKELEFLSNEEHGVKKKKMKVLSKVYNEKMDTGTTLFALYYKQWLKVGASEPPFPIVSLPSRPSYGSSRRRSSDSSISNSSINPNLYKAVFGPQIEQKSSGLGEQNGVLTISTCSATDEKLCGDEYNCNSIKKEDNMYPGRCLSQIDKSHARLSPESQKLDYLQWFSCRAIPTECFANSNYRSKNALVRQETSVFSSDFVGAIRTLCSSDILRECEFAIRVITKALLNSPGDPLIEEALTQTTVIEAIIEVLFASTEDDILELIISILAELIGRNNAIGEILLNSDPQLEIFVRLLRSSSLFLKAAVLLYLSKPQAKQMLSSEWVPLVLRVLEFGDKLQTLFTVQCSPQVAAYYFLDQLLTGFDEDKNLENARQVLSLGGLTLLMRRIEEGKFNEKYNASFIVLCCIQAEGSCRSFLADNINKTSLLELIVLGNKQNSSGYAFSVLVELLFLDRGESLMEKWLLQQAGFREISLEDSFPGNESIVHDSLFNTKDEEDESWQKRAACILFKSGNKNFLSALADSIANGIPCLARASLVTISWMSNYLHLVEGRKLPQMAFSILRPQLLQSLNYDKDVEERVLASYSLLSLTKNSACVSVLQSVDKHSLRNLRNLSLVTWTANELISIISKSSLQSRQ
ncbi:hypothetical protein TanjilG_27124 [Lupinus angustifolius]|uniref:E3 ubiquitin-protein ligase LIN n=1 Tax=Lupinus angustifolius TaxID=3871 RepID=A0A4P1QW83_LUPAN|nr:hypothetical protein TanjilG_27124 [Lupinus angustifolius]